MISSSLNSNPLNNTNKKNHLIPKIGVSGAADMGFLNEDVYLSAKEVGKEITAQGAILVTGATTGFPYWAAVGCKESKGISVGFSPASNEEDEKSLRNALYVKLTNEGFNVLEAENGEEGLEKAFGEHPDLILLDLVMPKMDGMTMLKKLRQKNKWSKNVPVMLLSNLGGDDEKMMMEIENDKMTDYLVKSNWSLSEVVKKVKEKLSLT